MFLRLKKYLEEKEGCDWYASGHKKNCISVNKNGTGLSELWRQQLSQFPLCTLEISEAISSVYSSPVALLEASWKNIDIIIFMHNVHVRLG